MAEDLDDQLGVQMPARASLRRGLLVDVLSDQGKQRKLVDHDASTDDELRGGQADVLGHTSQVADERGTGHVVDLCVSTGHDGALPALKGRPFAAGIGQPRGEHHCRLPAAIASGPGHEVRESAAVAAALVGDLRAPPVPCERELAACDPLMAGALDVRGRPRDPDAAHSLR